MPQVDANRATPLSPQDVVLQDTVYIVFDLETTGFSHKTNNIIEVAAEVLFHNWIPLQDGLYSSLICPPRPIPSIVSMLMGITQDMVEFFEFINNQIKSFG